LAVKVDKTKCSGCFACITACPEAAFVLLDGKAEVDNKLCISCGICQQECLEKAIALLPGKDLGGGGY
jgi:Pyruvate/2-oxoacid:ferredoxin oxidoreductase delta subunit